LLFSKALGKALDDIAGNPTIFIPSIIAAILVGGLSLILIKSMEKLGLTLFEMAIGGMETLTESMLHLSTLWILFLIINILVTAFVESTTLAMTKDLFTAKKTSLAIAWSGLGKHFTQILIFDILLLIILLVVTLFVGTALLIPFLLSGKLFDPTKIPGTFTWICLVLTGLGLTMVVYALLLFSRVSIVVDGKGVLEGIRRSYNFAIHQPGAVLFYGLSKLFALGAVFILTWIIGFPLIGLAEPEPDKLLGLPLAGIIMVQTILTYFVNAVFYTIKTNIYCFGVGLEEASETSETWVASGSETGQP